MTTPAPGVPKEIPLDEYQANDLPGVPSSDSDRVRHVPTSNFSRRTYLSNSNLDHRTFRKPVGATAALLSGEILTISFGFLIVQILAALVPEAWNLRLAAEQLPYALAMALALPFANLLAGVIPGYGLGAVHKLRLRALAATVMLTPGALMVIASPGMLPAWLHFLAAMLVAFPFVPAMDHVIRESLKRFGHWGEPVLIIGHGEAVPRIVRILQDNPALGWRPVAILDDVRQGTGMQGIKGVPVAGGLEKIRDFTFLVRTAIVAFPSEQTDRLVEMSERLPFPYVILMPDLAGMQTLWVSTCDLGGALGLQVRKELLIARNRALKMTLDYAFAVPAAIVAAPIVGLCALWIKLTDRGPAFYAQKREGYQGRVIKVWKLRTMYNANQEMLEKHLAEHPEARAEWEQHFKLRNDPRILPGVGHFLRRTSLDELPQFWNILRGDISLVGPRPFPMYHLEKFNGRFRALRRSVRPGLTGLWQVSARSEGDLRVQELQDTYYIRNWSPWLDVHIVTRTIGVVLRGTGAY